MIRYLIPALFLPVFAFAQDGAVGVMADSTSVDFTSIAVATIGALFTVIGSVAVALINARMKDKTSAQALDNAVTNGLGAIQQAADAHLATHPAQTEVPGINAAMAAGLQYVLDHAGDEAKRFGITPAAIVDKLNARLGLVKAEGTAK